VKWNVLNPKGRVASVIAVASSSVLAFCTWLWWPLYLLPLFGLLVAFSVLRLYQEWVEDGAWAR
jgi:hypothetical protein